MTITHPEDMLKLSLQASLPEPDSWSLGDGGTGSKSPRVAGAAPESMVSLMELPCLTLTGRNTQQQFHLQQDYLPNDPSVYLMTHSCLPAGYLL